MKTTPETNWIDGLLGSMTRATVPPDWVSVAQVAKARGLSYNRANGILLGLLADGKVQRERFHPLNGSHARFYYGPV